MLYVIEPILVLFFFLHNALYGKGILNLLQIALKNDLPHEQMNDKYVLSRFLKLQVFFKIECFIVVWGILIKL